MKKLPVTVIVVSVVALATLAAILFWPRQIQAPQRGAQTYTGKIICLPHKKSDGPHTMECAYGFATDDGQMYGLRTKTGLGGSYNIDDKVSVTGTLAAPDPNERYTVTGNIEVVAIKRSGLY